MENKMANDVIQYQKSDDILQDAKSIIEQAQLVAHRTVDSILVQRNWFLGQRIALEELKHKDRADYGAEIVKNPFIAEFLGFSTETDLSESKLESAILTNLQKFLMEIGKGYAFVARQHHIHTELELCFVHKQTKILPVILFCMVMNSCSPLNTNYICQQRKNSKKKLKSRL